ncbi:MAG TPA: MBL fold metallo-hydrolase, partial [Limnochordia bacterium]
MQPRFERIAPDLFCWQGDSCNVYVIQRDDAAILVDIGSGAVLDALGQIGVRRVEQVWFTQHQREQTQGAARIPATAQIVAPAAEGALFTDPGRFRTAEARPGPYTVGGALYVRLPREPVRVDRTVGDGDSLTWRGLSCEVYETAGASRGAVSYVLDRGGERWAFTGNVCLAGGKAFRLFDSEWDYGYAAGFQALLASQQLL